MTAKEWDNLRVYEDKVITFNGPYTQHGIVEGKWKDAKGMRWVNYKWFKNGKNHWGNKRYMSVYLEEAEPCQ